MIQAAVRRPRPSRARGLDIRDSIDRIDLELEHGPEPARRKALLAILERWRFDTMLCAASQTRAAEVARRHRESAAAAGPPRL